MWTFVELLLEVNLARNEEDLLGGFLALASRCGFVDSMARWWSLPLTLDLLNIMGHSLQKILCFKYRHSHFPLFNFFNCSFNIHKIPITLLSTFVLSLLNDHFTSPFFWQNSTHSLVCLGLCPLRNEQNTYSRRLNYTLEDKTTNSIFQERYMSGTGLFFWNQGIKNAIISWKRIPWPN